MKLRPFATLATRQTALVLALSFLGGALDPRVSFSRASPATYVGSDGLLKTAAVDAPRFDYDSTTPAGTTGVELATVQSATMTGSVGFTPIVSPLGDAAKTYKVSYTLNQTSGASQASFGGVGGPVHTGSASGNVSFFARSDGTNGATYFCNAAVGAVTNFSVQEVTFTPRGLLIEEARTNLLLWSRDFTNAAWTRPDSTTQLNQVGIGGVANSACLVTEGSTGNAQVNQTQAVTASATVTGSFVFKRGNTDWIRISPRDNNLAGVDAWFNLATGAKGTTTLFGTGASNGSSAIQGLGGGWYRCSATFTTQATTTSVQTFCCSASADASQSRVNNATYIVDCAQLEVGAFATSIIPTTTAAVTRGGDTALMNGTNLTSWLTGNTGTVVAEMSGRFGLGGALWSFDAAGNTLGEYVSDANNIAVTFESVPGAASPISVNTLNTFKSAYGFAPNDRAYCIGGGSVSTSATGGLPASVDTLRFGHNRANVGIGSMYLRRFTYYNTRLPDATLQALTA